MTAELPPGWAHDLNSDGYAATHGRQVLYRLHKKGKFNGGKIASGVPEAARAELLLGPFAVHLII